MTDTEQLRFPPPPPGTPSSLVHLITENFTYALCPNSVDYAIQLVQCPCLFIRYVCVVTNGHPLSTSLFGVMNSLFAVIAFITILVRVSRRRAAAKKMAMGYRALPPRTASDRRSMELGGRKSLGVPCEVDSSCGMGAEVKSAVNKARRRRSDSFMPGRNPELKNVQILPMHFAYMCVAASVVFLYALGTLFLPHGYILSEILQPLLMGLLLVCQILPIVYLSQKSWGGHALKQTLKVSVPLILSFALAIAPLVIIYEMTGDGSYGPLAVPKNLQYINFSEALWNPATNTTATYLGPQGQNIAFVAYHSLSIICFGTLSLLPFLRRRFPIIEERFFLAKITHPTRTSALPLTLYLTVINVPFLVGASLYLVYADVGVCIWESTLMLFLLTFAIALNESLKADTEFIRKMSRNPQSILQLSGYQKKAGSKKRGRGPSTPLSGQRSVQTGVESPSSPLLENAVNRQLAMDDTTVLTELCYDFSEISLEKVINRGAAGEVYSGWLRGIRVALKKMYVEIFDEKTMAEALTEAIILSRLQHENVVEFRGICFQPPYLYVITSLCEDNVHMKLIRHCDTLTYGDGLRWARDIARAMTYLHGLDPPVLHRDLKSANLLVAFDGRIRVCDFDISSTAVASIHQRKARAPGTIQWTAPEVMRDINTATWASDVYSFSIIILEILSSIVKKDYVFPFSEISRGGFGHIIEDAVTSKYRPPIPDEIPREIKLLLQRCWDHDPHQRPPFSEILEILETMVSSS